jgi:hypothetical protein
MTASRAVQAHNPEAANQRSVRQRPGVVHGRGHDRQPTETAETLTCSPRRGCYPGGSLDLLLIAFAVVFPGAAAVRVWDFVGRIENRPKETMYAMGAFFGLLPYLALQLLRKVDLRNLFKPDGKLEMNAVLATNNLVMFFSVTAVLVLAAWGMSRAAHSAWGRNKTSKLLGRTFGGSNWAEVSDDALGLWVNVKTRDGLEWIGILHTIPDTAEGYVALADPEYHDPLNEQWIAGASERVLLAVKDLLYLSIVRDSANDDHQEGKQEQQRDSGGQQDAQRTINGQPAAATGSNDDGNTRTLSDAAGS